MVQLNNENVMNAIGFEKRVQNGHTVRLLGDVLPMVWLPQSNGQFVWHTFFFGGGLTVDNEN